MGKRVIQQRSRWTKGTKGKRPEKVHPPAGKGCDKGGNAKDGLVGKK